MALLFIHVFLYFFFNDTATTEIYTLSLHDALPISPTRLAALTKPKDPRRWKNQSVRCPVRNEQIQDRTLAGCPPLYRSDRRSEEHTSELQSQSNLVCRLLLDE